MELELKHLAPYLPYGLKIFCHKSFPLIDHFEMNSSGGTGFVAIMELTVSYRSYKPILRPMSDFDKMQNDFDLTTDFETAYYTSNKDVAFVCTSDKVYLSDFNTVMEFIFKNHIDIFGLIDAGLAIDINTLNPPKEQNNETI